MACSSAEQVDVLALARPDHRGEHLEPGALLHRQHPVDDLLRGLPGDRLAADRAVRLADAGVEQPEVVVDLGDGADGRARVAGGRLLVDRDRRRQALDEVDVRLVHLAEELPRVGRQRLDVAALALGEDRVEGQARLARAGQPGEHDQRVAGQVEVDVLEVVLAGAADDEPVHVIPVSRCGQMHHQKGQGPASGRCSRSPRAPCRARHAADGAPPSTCAQTGAATGGAVGSKTGA